MHRIRLLTFEAFEKVGFDQFGGASNEYYKENFGPLKKYCREVVSAENFKGIMQTTWKSTTEQKSKELFEAAELIKEALSI